MEALVSSFFFHDGQSTGAKIEQTPLHPTSLRRAEPASLEVERDTGGMHGRTFPVGRGGISVPPAESALKLHRPDGGIQLHGRPERRVEVHRHVLKGVSSPRTKVGAIGWHTHRQERAGTNLNQFPGIHKFPEVAVVLYPGQGQPVRLCVLFDEGIGGRREHPEVGPSAGESRHGQK